MFNSFLGGSSYLDAAINSTGISNEQLMKNFANRLKSDVMNTQTVSWPPKINELEEEEELSQLLIQFLHSLKYPTIKSINESPRIRSIASILTQYITGKRTTTCINFGIDLHGHTRSKALVNNWHTAGIIISYSDIQLLYEKWTVDKMSDSVHIPCEIANGRGAICIVDNDDFKIDTLTGKATQAHRTNVMFVQQEKFEEVNAGDGSEVITGEESDYKSTITSYTLEQKRNTSYVVPRNCTSEPAIRKTSRPQTEILKQRKRSLMHCLLRTDMEGKRPNATLQKIPSYAGFQSKIYTAVEKSKAYYQATFPEPPKKPVMFDIMSGLVIDMQKKNIPFIFLVGDLPTYVHIVELKAESNTLFKDIIPTMGAFHQQCSFIYSIYKRFLGSGIADILVSADVLVDGSVDQALKGKHYRRGLRALGLIREALLTLRLSENRSSETISKDLHDAIDSIRICIDSGDKTKLLQLLNNNFDNEEFTNLVDQIYQSNSTDMGDFWLSFLEDTDVLFQNIHACHIGNFEEYVSSTYDMLRYMMAYNNHNYGRWLPDYWASIHSLPEEVYNFMKNNFSQSMTGLPYSQQPMDLWIECTMNLRSKLKRGWLNLLDNEKQLLCTTRNVNNVARIRIAIQKTLEQRSRNRIHVECQPARMRNDEKRIQDILACFVEFDSDPFGVVNPALRTLQSGFLASSELVSDFKLALSEEEQLESFLAGLIMIVNLVEESNVINFRELMEYRITSECLSVFNVNGSMRKNQKSKLMQCFDLNPTTENVESYVAIIDMGFVWRLATPNKEDRDISQRSGTEYSWGDYTKKWSV